MLVDVDFAGGKHPTRSRHGGIVVTVGRLFGSAAPPGRAAATAGKDAATLAEVLSPRASGPGRACVGLGIGERPLIKPADGRMDYDRLLQGSAARCARVVRRAWHLPVWGGPYRVGGDPQNAANSQDESP